MFARSAFLTAAAVLLPAASASAAVVVFDDDFTTNASGVFDGQNSASITESGVTLTLSVADPVSNFETTGGGIGVNAAGAQTNSPAFDVEGGEVFTISFDAVGTLDSFDVRALNGGGGDVTFTNLATSDSTTASINYPASGFSDQTVSFSSLGFSAGDTISVTSDAGSRYRVRALTTDIIPEPASAALLAAGLACLASRRRNA